MISHNSNKTGQEIYDSTDRLRIKLFAGKQTGHQEGLFWTTMVRSCNICNKYSQCRKSWGCTAGDATALPSKIFFWVKLIRLGQIWLGVDKIQAKFGKN